MAVNTWAVATVVTTTESNEDISIEKVGKVMPSGWIQSKTKSGKES